MIANRFTIILLFGWIWESFWMQCWFTSWNNMLLVIAWQRWKVHPVSIFCQCHSRNCYEYFVQCIVIRNQSTWINILWIIVWVLLDMTTLDTPRWHDQGDSPRAYSFLELCMGHSCCKKNINAAQATRQQKNNKRDKSAKRYRESIGRIEFQHLSISTLITPEYRDEMPTWIWFESKVW